MANPEHVTVVRQGRDATAKWRRSHPGVRLDLSEADLSRADLSDTNLRGANLSEANLSEANLSKAKLDEADLSDVNLSRADLSGAYLFRADLFGAGLGKANLGNADLFRADLSLADLRGAKLVAANLVAVHLLATNLSGADFSQATLGNTSLNYIDLSHVIGLSTVTHSSPSSVGVETLIASVRGAGNALTADIRAFFRDVGVPEEFLEALPRIVGEVQYYSTFICYGQPDLSFAQKLYDELKAKGVSCWLYEMDATVGKRTWEEIVGKRRENEKMVVLCSSAALVRDGVLKEIEEQIDEDLDKLVPISLDDLWKEPGFKVMRGNRDLKLFLLDRNLADFANLKYKKALERLLKGLRRK